MSNSSLPAGSDTLDPDARRYALILGLCLALHHGRFGGFNLTPFEIQAARFHIARLEREIAASDDLRNAA